MQLGNWDGERPLREDVSRKFAGTYVEAIIPGFFNDRPKVVKLAAFEDDNVLFSFIGNRRLREQEEAPWATVDIQRYMPNFGVVPTGPSVIIIQKRPDRQWHTGFCHLNVNLYRADLIRDQNLIGLEYAEYCYNPVYPNGDMPGVLAQVLRELKEPEIFARALNSTYWVKKQDKNSFKLLRNLLPIGTFAYEKFFCNQACKSFRQELWDHFRLQV